MDRVLSTMHALHHNVEMHTAAYTEGHSKHALQCGPRKVGDIVNNPSQGNIPLNERTSQHIDNCMLFHYRLGTTNQ